MSFAQSLTVRQIRMSLFNMTNQEMEISELIAWMRSVGASPQIADFLSQRVSRPSMTVRELRSILFEVWMQDEPVGTLCVHGNGFSY